MKTAAHFTLSVAAISVFGYLAFNAGRLFAAYQVACAMTNTLLGHGG